MTALTLDAVQTPPVTDCGCYQPAEPYPETGWQNVAVQTCRYDFDQHDQRPCSCQCHTKRPSSYDYAQQVVDYVADMRNYPGPAMTDQSGRSIIAFVPPMDTENALMLLLHAAEVAFARESISNYYYLGQSTNNADRATVLTGLVRLLEGRQFPAEEIELFKRACLDRFWPR